jgi:hypothetical protein
MPAYRSAGGLDDPPVGDGDRGFVGVNNRLPVNLLSEGEVIESLNGRMEGYWKPRGAVQGKGGVLGTGTFPLLLDFFLVDAAKVVSSAARSGNVVTLTFGTAHGLTGSGYLVLGDVTVGTAPLTGTTNVLAGAYLMTVASGTTLTFSNTGGDESLSVNATYGKVWTQLYDDAVSDVRASCLFSDPNTAGQEFAVVFTNTKAFKISLSDYAVTTVNYVNGVTLEAGDEVDAIQAFDRVMLFRNGKASLEWHPNGREVLSASQSTTTVTVTMYNHGFTAGTSIVVSGLTGGTPANGTFTVATVTSVDTFTYTFGTSQTQTFGVANAKVTDGFVYSPAGAYTQPQQFSITSSSVSVADGLVSLTVTGNTTIRVGDRLFVHYVEIPTLVDLQGKSFTVVSANSTTITFYAPAGDLSAGGSHKFEFGGQFSLGGGFIHQPGAPWGTYFQRRLWVPFLYSTGGTYSSPTYTSRSIVDEVAASDILDTATFDQIANQFRVSGGTADYVVAMHGFYDDGLIVLNRNSLHLISGTQGSLTDTVVKELTSEVGCLARKSVVVIGNNLLFLSDNGVYGMSFMNDYNLRGAEEPLSKNIQPYIDRINKSLASKSVAAYHDNRYYLAVPLDSEDGTEATGNNSILVFNFLNKGWESLHTFGLSTFNIMDFVIGSADGKNDLYVVSDIGGLHLLEAAESQEDELISSIVTGAIEVTPVTSKLKTRGYDFKTLERKKFSDVQVQMQSRANSLGEFSIGFSTEDPDSETTLGTTTQFFGEILGDVASSEEETGNCRARIGVVRGITGIVSLTRTVGSPKVHSVLVNGFVANRATLSQK